MKKKIKMLIYLSLIILIFQIICFPIKSNAFDWSFFSKADKALGEVGSPSVDTITLREASSNMYNMLFDVGAVLSVIVGGILGIQYIIASAEDKAKIKETIIPYIIGCVIIFGAYGIWKIAVAIGQNLN